MSRKDDINISKNILVGNTVSHSNRKTKRLFAPNIQNFTFTSKVLGNEIKLKSTPSTMRTIVKFNGIDNFLIKSKIANLTTKALNLRKKIIKAMHKQSLTTTK